MHERLCLRLIELLLLPVHRNLGSTLVTSVLVSVDFLWGGWPGVAHRDVCCIRTICAADRRCALHLSVRVGDLVVGLRDSEGHLVSLVDVVTLVNLSQTAI